MRAVVHSLSTSNNPFFRIYTGHPSPLIPDPISLITLVVRLFLKRDRLASGSDKFRLLYCISPPSLKIGTISFSHVSFFSSFSHSCWWVFSQVDHQRHQYGLGVKAPLTCLINIYCMFLAHFFLAKNGMRPFIPSPRYMTPPLVGQLWFCGIRTTMTFFCTSLSVTNLFASLTTFQKTNAHSPHAMTFPHSSLDVSLFASRSVLRFSLKLAPLPATVSYPAPLRIFFCLWRFARPFYELGHAPLRHAAFSPLPRTFFFCMGIRHD